MGAEGHNSDKTLQDRAAALKLSGLEPAQIAAKLGATTDEVKQALWHAKRRFRFLAEREAEDLIALQKNMTVELALVARGGEPIYDEVFGHGPLPRNGSPALDEDGNVALPASRVVTGEDLAAPLFRTLDRTF